jgi:hypothetical protein
MNGTVANSECILTRMTNRRRLFAHCPESVWRHVTCTIRFGVVARKSALVKFKLMRCASTTWYHSVVNVAVDVVLHKVFLGKHDLTRWACRSPLPSLPCRIICQIRVQS